MSYYEWNIIHISKFKPGTVEKNSSTVGPPDELRTEVPQNRYVCFGTCFFI